MEMYDNTSLEGPGDSSSTESLVTSSCKHPSNPFGKCSRYSDYGTDEDMLARAIQDSDEDNTESKTSSIINLLKKFNANSQTHTVTGRACRTMHNT